MQSASRSVKVIVEGTYLATPSILFWRSNLSSSSTATRLNEANDRVSTSICVRTFPLKNLCQNYGRSVWHQEATSSMRGRPPACPAFSSTACWKSWSWANPGTAAVGEFKTRATAVALPESSTYFASSGEPRVFHFRSIMHVMSTAIRSRRSIITLNRGMLFIE